MEGSMETPTAIPALSGEIGGAKTTTDTNIPVASQIQENENDSMLGNDVVNATRIAQLMTLGKGAVSFIGSSNPFQGIKSLPEVASKVKKEAKNFVNPTQFSKPQSRQELTTRISSNFSSFKFVYIIMYISVMVYFVLSSPFLLFELGVVAAVWAVFFKLNPADKVVQIGQHQFGRKEKIMVMGSLTLFVAFFGGLISCIVYSLVWGTMLVGVHASFREQLQADPLDELEDSMQGLENQV